MAKTATPDEQLAQAQADLAQRDDQIVALNERVAELAGYQKEAVDSRDLIVGLEEDLAQAQRNAEAASHDASEARSIAKSVDSKNAANADLVASAQALAAAIKNLS